MSNNHFSLFTFRSSLKKYPFSVACITLIWILSFVPFFPETPLDDVQFMSGIIEILQEHCTNHTRSGEWFDFLANSTGVTLGAVIGLLLAHVKVFNKHFRHLS